MEKQNSPQLLVKGKDRERDRATKKNQWVQ